VSRAPEREPFERAFVATSYALGRRGEDLLAPLEEPTAQARALAGRLARPEREQRAQALAPELARLGAALDARRLR
jgi:hypothetical protein